MRIQHAFLLAVALTPFWTSAHHLAFAQTQPARKPASASAVAPAAPLRDGWEEIDKRLLFLMVRLASVEASLDAVEKKLGVNTRQQAARVGDAKRAELGNEMMDRKGGGPVKWSQFYGRTAEKFFYHPTDRNTTYHTLTVLGQRSPADDNQVEAGVPSRQGLPVHQRPPQFDYIYKANRDAQARAEQEAAQFGNKIESLQARRRQLEDEQAALWCQIAFRAVTRYDFARKPLFRFEPIPADTDTDSRQKAEAVKAAAIFMRRGLSIVEEAEKDQGKAFANIKLVIADANEKLDDSLLQLDTVIADASNQETAVGRFSALARRLKDIADNISDSYEVAIDGDRFKDEVLKDTFRGLLQESLVDYAEVVLAMNEMALVMQSEAKTKPNVSAPLKFVKLEMSERANRLTVKDGISSGDGSSTEDSFENDGTSNSLSTSVERGQVNTKRKPSTRGRTRLATQTLTFNNEEAIRKHWRVDGQWQIENQSLKLLRGAQVIFADALAEEFELSLFLRYKKLQAFNEKNVLRVLLQGESIAIPLADCRNVRIRKTLDSIDVVVNEQPQSARQLQIRSANQMSPTTLEFKIESGANRAEWEPEVWFLEAQLRMPRLQN